jgi:F-type H+-transporting ATPase subunit epsilon
VNARLPLRIVTPEKVSWEGEVDSLTVPAWDGSLGVLPGHAPLLAQLTPGVVRIRQTGGDERLLAVSGGFVEVAEGKAALFAETAEMAEEIDAERARQALEQAKKNLKASPAQVLDEQALAALRRALIRLQVAELARLKPRSSQAPRPHE